MIGVDIVEIKRIEKAISPFPNRFVTRIFTPKEIEYCTHKSLSAQRFAGRFAAKEAVAKLIKKGPRWFWLDIEILPDDSGAPTVLLSQSVQHLHPEPIHISISHCKEYAVASAISSIKN
tara:strand:- start:5385 stop:5741 length:357 start_codon:yes stop_codon:yes gene_type:complete